MSDTHKERMTHATHNIMSRERVATRVTVRTVKKGDNLSRSSPSDVSGEHFAWLNNTACVDLSIGHFFVEAGHAIDDDVLNLCRGCPVRRECLDHSYAMGISGGYFGGMSPGQRRSMSVESAREFIANDPVQ